VPSTASGSGTSQAYLPPGPERLNWSPGIRSDRVLTSGGDVIAEVPAGFLSSFCFLAEMALEGSGPCANGRLLTCAGCARRARATR